MSENDTAQVNHPPGATTTTPIEKLMCSIATMCADAHMVDGTIKALGSQNRALHQQVSELTANNTKLRHDLQVDSTTIAPPETTATVAISRLKRLMQINAEMFEGTIRVLGQQNTALYQQLSELRAVNARLLLDNGRLLHELGQVAETIAELTHK